MTTHTVQQAEAESGKPGLSRWIWRIILMIAGLVVVGYSYPVLYRYELAGRASEWGLNSTQSNAIVEVWLPAAGSTLLLLLFTAFALAFIAWAFAASLQFVENEGYMFWHVFGSLVLVLAAGLVFADITTLHLLF
jgi:hypothetical protein